MLLKLVCVCVCMFGILRFFYIFISTSRPAEDNNDFTQIKIIKKNLRKWNFVDKAIRRSHINKTIRETNESNADEEWKNE